MSGFHLTRRAARDLRDVHTRSVARWGKARADQYLAELYAVCGRIAGDPAMGRLRARRSAPFLMVAAGRHFIVYDVIADRVVVLTVLHQVRDIERHIAELGPGFRAEIDALRRAAAGGAG